MSNYIVNNSTLKKVILSAQSINFVSKTVSDILNDENNVKPGYDGEIEYLKTFVGKFNDFMDAIVFNAVIEVVGDDLTDAKLSYKSEHPVIKITYGDKEFVLDKTDEARSIYTFVSMKRLLYLVLTYSTMASIYSYAFNEDMDNIIMNQIIKENNDDLIADFAEKLSDLSKLNENVALYTMSSSQISSLFYELVDTHMIEVVSSIINVDKEDIDYDSLSYTVLQEPELEVILERVS